MFSEGVERALLVALEAHQGQMRKGGAIPYAVHPLHVALLLARLGATDEVIQAGLLHDVVEDAEGWSIARIEADFGPRVTAIVSQLTEDKRKSWQERKELAIGGVPSLSPEAALVKACDKLHNLESLARALRAASDPSLVWGHFRGGREKTLRMSEELIAALRGRIPAAVSDALERALRAIQSSPPETARSS